MSPDLLTQIRTSLADFRTYIFGPLIGYVQQFYLSGYFWASSYVWISIFWSLNWLIGSGLALSEQAPLPGQPDKRWNPRRSLKSVVKLVTWILALLVATGISAVNIPGGWVPAGIIRAAIVFTEGAYLLRNLGRIARKIGNHKQGDMLSLAADRTDEFVGGQVHTRTVVTVQEIKTIVSPDPGNQPPPEE